MVVLPAPEGEERTNNTPRRFRWTFSAMVANCARDGGGQGPRGQGTMALGTSRGGWLVAAGLLLLLTAILLAMGRPPICPCRAAEHPAELQSLLRISSAVLCMNKISDNEQAVQS